MGIPVIPFLEGLEHFFQGVGATFGRQLVKAALGADHGIGRHENLDLGVGKNGGADIPAVHDYAAAGGKAVQAFVHPGAHERIGAYRTGQGANFAGADEGFHFLGSAVQSGGAGFLLKMQIQGREEGFEGGFCNAAIGLDDAGLPGRQGYTAVHGAAVQVQEAEFLGHKLGKSALSGGGEAVNGNDDIG